MVALHSCLFDVVLASRNCVWGVPSHQCQNNQEHLKLSTFFLIMRHYTWALVCSWFTVHGCSSFSTMLWLFDTSPSCSSNDNFGLNMARMLLVRRSSRTLAAGVNIFNKNCIQNFQSELFPVRLDTFSHERVPLLLSRT
jgi:hypothetical protein